MTSWRMKPSAILKSFAMAGSAGVTIVDENGEMKVKSDTRIVTVHLRFCDQFRGFLGSSGPSQVICSACQPDPFLVAMHVR